MDLELSVLRTTDPEPVSALEMGGKEEKEALKGKKGRHHKEEERAQDLTSMFSAPQLDVW